MTANEDVFESAIRQTQDLAGVYEQDADGGYFYLYDLTREEGRKIVAAIQVHSVDALVLGGGVEIRWNAGESVVGLFVAGKLLAAFSEAGQKWRVEKESVESPQWLQQAFSKRNSH
jgi:hypothetical protein